MSPHIKSPKGTIAEEIAKLTATRNELRKTVLDLSESGTYSKIQTIAVRIKSISQAIRDLEFQL
jgi:hypothetical protein